MENNQKYFYLLDENSDLIIEGNKENKTLKIIDLFKDGVHPDFLDDMKNISIYLKSFVFNLLIKKIRKEHLKKKVLKLNELKDLHNIITIKGDDYYQLVVDSNNYTYELKKYTSKSPVSNAIELEDFVFDLLLEALIEAKFISLSKKIDRELVLKGINGNLSYSAMKFLMQYTFENGNYYSFEAIEKQIKAYYSKKINLEYFKLWCKFVSEALTRTNSFNKSQCYFDISNLLENAPTENEEISHFLYASFKYLNHKLVNENDEFSTNGIIRIVSFDNTENDIDLFNILIIDTNKKVYNCEKSTQLEFDDKINYKVVDLEKTFDFDYDDGYYTSYTKYFDTYLEIFKIINKGIYKLDKNLF